tara:strand:+ start:23 stop:379 length:357 start_codon:yes stop_codon:yes gene_type:complete
MAIQNAQLTTTQLDLVTVPSDKSYAITNIMVCNTFDPNDGAAASNGASFDIHLIKSGQALSNSITCVVRELSLPAGETFTFDSERIVLEQGDKVSFVAQPNTGSGNTNLSAVVSYLEV